MKHHLDLRWRFRLKSSRLTGHSECVKHLAVLEDVVNLGPTTCAIESTSLRIITLAHHLLGLLFHHVLHLVECSRRHSTSRQFVEVSHGVMQPCIHIQATASQVHKRLHGHVYVQLHWQIVYVIRNNLRGQPVGFSCSSRGISRACGNRGKK